MESQPKSDEELLLQAAFMAEQARNLYRNPANSKQADVIAAVASISIASSLLVLARELAALRQLGEGMPSAEQGGERGE
ncbi:MAG: hypothetical protein M3Y81_22100 [Chloroflexota bacterium]|nr:hypothetical protein [Chloroflexota bacterium]